ncbi:hypothetical protein D3C85_1539660 [compost metagenome]
MVLQQFLDHFDSTCKLRGGRVGDFQVRQHQRVHSTVLFLGFVIHHVLLFATGFFISRIQDFFLKSGMNADFHLKLGQQLGAFFNAAFSGFAQLAQDAFYTFMVSFQQIDGVHGQVSQVITGVSANGLSGR